MSNVADVQVLGLDRFGMARAFSKRLGGEGAVLVLSYPKVDARNHKSRDALTAALSGHGMPRMARLLQEETPFVVLDNPVAALKVYREIQQDSLAIGVLLFFKGESGGDAERLILDGIQRVPDSLAGQQALVHAHAARGHESPHR